MFNNQTTIEMATGEPERNLDDKLLSLKLAIAILLGVSRFVNQYRVLLVERNLDNLFLLLQIVMNVTMDILHVAARFINQNIIVFLDEENLEDWLLRLMIAIAILRGVARFVNQYRVLLVERSVDNLRQLIQIVIDVPIEILHVAARFVNHVLLDEGNLEDWLQLLKIAFDIIVWLFPNN